MKTFEDHMKEIKERAAKQAKEIQAKLLANDLDKVREQGGHISFCTNSMMSRGTVYHCKVDEEGDAIIQSTQQWWSMQYTPHDETKKGRVLGKIKRCYLPNHNRHFKVNGLCEGRG